MENYKNNSASYIPSYNVTAICTLPQCYTPARKNGLADCKDLKTNYSHISIVSVLNKCNFEA